MNTSALVKATIAGLVLQLAMVIAGHELPAIKELFAVGGMGFSLIAGLIYAALARGSTWPAALGGGTIAGGVCALLGIAVSALLNDVPVTLLVLGTVSSVVTGAVGGALGKLIWRR
jgi:hypothetical protein